MTCIRAIALTCLMLSPAMANAGDSDRGRELAWQYRCLTCHGTDGRSVDQRYPKLAGQKAAYILTRLEYFQAETEPFNKMNGQARPLTEEMKRDLAAYFSEQQF